MDLHRHGDVLSDPTAPCVCAEQPARQPPTKVRIPLPGVKALWPSHLRMVWGDGAHSDARLTVKRHPRTGPSGRDGLPGSDLGLSRKPLMPISQGLTFLGRNAVTPIPHLSANSHRQAPRSEGVAAFELSGGAAQMAE